MAGQDYAQLKKLAEEGIPDECAIFNSRCDAIEQIIVPPSTILALLAQLEEAEKFKKYVHDRLDEIEIDKHEEQNAINGCRIGARLNDVVTQTAQLLVRVCNESRRADAAETALRSLRDSQDTQLKDICHLNAQVIFALSSLIALIETAAGVFPQNPMGEWLSRQGTFLKAKEALTTNRNAFEERAAALAGAPEGRE